jgi:CMP-N,N'-diacetyllegionaminic acid synthase
MNLAVIPARGNSRSIKNKNLSNLGNKPLIAYSIKTALSCRQIDRVIVSTDNEKIAAVAKNYGADIPFIRPENLATDTTPMIAVLTHALKEIEKQEKKKITNIVLLDPTSPFRNQQDISNCFKVLEKPNTDSVVTVCEAEHNPYFVMRKIKNDYLVPIVKVKKIITRRQDAPKTYRINAAVYIIKRNIILKNKIFTSKTRPVIMPIERSVHIDEPMDLEVAEFLLKKGYVKL